jgi:hypothetical protein
VTVSALFYLGVMLVVTGVVILATRRRWGWLALACGIAVGLLGLYLPVSDHRVLAPASQLDRLMPTFQHHERHNVEVNTACARAYRAIKELRVSEIRLFRTLTWIRRMGRPTRESILNPSDSIPVLEVATRTGFVTLADEPGREIVVGVVVINPQAAQRVETPEQFLALTRPGVAKAAMNFQLVPEGPGRCSVSTETRIYANNERARRTFGVYWRVIYPGSSLLRRMWLRAVKKRAEASSQDVAWSEQLVG